MSDCAERPGFNLATLPAEARAALNADLIACRIRWECRGLVGEEKKRKGRQLLSAYSSETRELIAAALKRRGAR